MRDRMKIQRQKTGTSSVTNPSLVSPTSPTLANPTRNFTSPQADTVLRKTQEIQSSTEQPQQEETLKLQGPGHDIGRISLRRQARSELTIQRDEVSSLPPVPNYQLTPPSLLQPPDAATRYGLGQDLHFQLDPQLQLMAMQYAQQQVSPTNIQPALTQLNLGTLPTGASSPSAGGTPTPNPSATTMPPPSPLLVPAGAGPDTPREATTGDLLKAVVAIPSVDNAITSLQSQVSDRISQDWQRLRTGEQIGVASSLAIIGGGALAGVFTDPTAQQLALSQLNGRVLPVPGLNWLRLEMNTEKDGLMLGLHVDVGRLLPPSLGFGSASISPIGGAPQPEPFVPGPPPIQRKASDSVTPLRKDIGERIQAASGSGSSLNPNTQQHLEKNLGADLSGVRIHTDSQADRLTRDVNAVAFTTGQDIFFSAGCYNPNSLSGKHLIAHEVVHTRQQAAGAVAGTETTGGMSISDPSDSYEQEAERIADQVMQIPASETATDSTDSIDKPNRVSRKRLPGHGFNSIQVNHSQSESTVNRVEALEAQSGSHMIIQRDLTEDQKKSWRDNKGEQFVNQIKASVGEWKKFRGKPEAYEQIPKATNEPSEFADLLRLSEPAYKQYTSEQLGFESVAYLSEMAAFVPEYRILIGVIPSFAYVNPNHKYKMTANKDSNLSLPWYIPVDLPLSGLKIEYSNAFGWSWQKELTGTQLNWQVGFGYEKGESPSGSGMGGSLNDKKGNPKTGLKNPLLPQPAGISINTEATATSVGYWGYRDLVGLVTIANGPSAKISFHGYGAKTASGGIISLEGSGGGPPGALDFMNVVSKFEVKLAKPGLGKPSDPTGKGDLKKNLEVSFKLLEEGVGVLVGGAEQVAIPELKPEPVSEEKIWKYVVSGFETGSTELPIPEGEVHPIIEMIRQDIEDKKKNVESIKPYLEEAGIQQEFKLDFYIEGYASRRWTGAANNDSVRQQKNLELSTQRAQNVATMLNTAFGSDHTYAFEGKGAAAYLPQPGSNFGQVIPESGNEELIEQMIRERTEQYTKDRPNLSPDSDRKMAEMDRKIIETNLGKSSDVFLSRRVNITVIWRGQNVKWGANASPAPDDPNTSD